MASTSIHHKRLPSPATSDIEEDDVYTQARTKRNKRDYSQERTPSPSLPPPRYQSKPKELHTLKACSAVLFREEDPFAAPKNGRVYKGKGLDAKPKRETTYVYRGKKVQVVNDHADEDEDEAALIASIKPKLLFPSTVPPVPRDQFDMSPIRTPQKSKKPANNGPYIPPTPQSLVRPRKISSDLMDIDSDVDVFGGDTATKWRKDFSLAKRVGGNNDQHSMLWQ